MVQQGSRTQSCAGIAGATQRDTRMGVWVWPGSWPWPLRKDLVSSAPSAEKSSDFWEDASESQHHGDPNSWTGRQASVARVLKQSSHRLPLGLS